MFAMGRKQTFTALPLWAIHERLQQAAMLVGEVDQIHVRQADHAKAEEQTAIWCLTRVYEPQQGRAAEHWVRGAASLNPRNSLPDGWGQSDLPELASTIRQHICLCSRLGADWIGRCNAARRQKKHS